MSFCDVTVTSILQEKIGNIVFLKLHIFHYLRIDINHFYPKIPMGAQISTQLPTLNGTDPNCLQNISRGQKMLLAGKDF